ncbi:MAG: glutamyl-tRNA reductase [Planctomycetaceae bacterium]|nr:glutamyl-tRNA reductase [Planctomycetaceae bacterium]
MLSVVGLNHHTAPVSVREMVAFAPQQIEVALKNWMEQHDEFEAVLLSTCNRTEFYVAGEIAALPDAGTLFEFLCREKQLIPEQADEIFRHGFSLEGKEASLHLFTVATSLDSMVLGESQVLAQVKAAYQTADEIGSTGPITHFLFQSALKIAKLVASQTKLYQHRVSIPSIAVVDFALRIFERLEDKRTLLFGVGEVGEETLQYLKEHGAKSITIANRSRDKAEELAAKWSGTAVDWEARFEALKTADLLISTTGATEPVLTYADFKRIEPFRKGKPLFVLDLAVPRDIEPSIGDLPDVYLYSIDDLQAACEKNRRLRDQEVPKAKKILEQENERFYNDLRARKTGEIIKQLREGWNSRKEEELRRLFNKLPDLNEQEQAEIRYSFDRLVGKLLHPPMQSLRDEPPESGSLLNALKRLFGL